MSLSSGKLTLAGASMSFDADLSISDRRAQLDHYYYFVKHRFFLRQSGTLGLFSSSSQNLPIAKIRDNVYVATALWALSSAYRLFDDDQGRGYELQQSAVKCMRSILFCYMQHADKVECFKETQSRDNSLPAHFHYETGEPIHDPECRGHLQMDAVALYVLQLAQMTQAGLQVIFTMGEVNFVQNLVYYIERAYRTPDFGMWQRGRNDNSGRMELHASSIGLVKAALESIDGVNLYGPHGTTLTLIHVDPDALHRNSSTLNSLLPRESNSRETDAALLSIVSFPGYAIDDKELTEQTRRRVISKLKGRCGMKRFSRDSQYSVLEESVWKVTEPVVEQRALEGVESEWPMFLCYMAIDRFSTGDKAGARQCMDQVERLLDKDSVLPKCFFVEKEYLEAERIGPHSHYRQALPETQPWLWGQSLYLISCLLITGLLDMCSIDPLGRNLPTAMIGYRPQKQDFLRTAEKSTVIQVSLIAESVQLQARLATYGIATQTVQQVEPIAVLPQSTLVEVLKELGVNQRLSLSGRPARPKGALGTSMVYRIKGNVVVFTPLFMAQTNFYMSTDMNLLLDVIKDNLKFIFSNWSKPKRPLMVLLLRANHVTGNHFQEMLEMMAAFKHGEWEGIPVKLGRLQQFIATSFLEPLDFVKQDIHEMAKDDSVTIARARMSRISINAPFFRASTSTRPSRSPPPPMMTSVLEESRMDFSKLYSSKEILELFEDCVLMSSKLKLLGRLFLSYGPEFETPLGSVTDVVKSLYDEALLQNQDWHSIRLGASLLGKTVESLAPSITLMVAVNRQVCLGVFGHSEHVISEPLPPSEIQTILFNNVRPIMIADAALQQELVIFLGSLVTTQPKLFEGMQRIRLGWLTQAMHDELLMSGEYGDTETLYDLSPSSIKQLLYAVLSGRYQNAERTWLQQRRREGSLNRVPNHFYEKVLQVLQRSHGGISLFKRHLPQEPLISDSQPQDKSFILCVEELLSQSPCPEYRQLIVELFVVIASLFERNCEVNITESVALDELLASAASMYGAHMKTTEEPDHFENGSKPTEVLAFAESCPHGGHGTAAYLLRATVDYVFHSSADLDTSKCIIS